jgi:CIC family chloride channel protein
MREGRIHDFFRSRETSINIILGVIVGIGTGFGAIGFRWLIEFFKKFFFDGGSQALGFLDGYYVIFIPALGGLVVGTLVYFFAREAKGHGVPEVMAAVAFKGGIIRPRVVVAKALASAVCIGSGGSAGREGPIVQIGSAIGSVIGQVFKVNTRRLKTFVACGTAGAIAATFNAPIGGVLFALEVIMGQFSGSHLVSVIVSAVMAASISRFFLGDIPAFIVPAYPLHNLWELLLYAALGILSGIFAMIFIRTLYKFEDLCDMVKTVPEYLKPALGGLIIGAIGFFYPQIFGVGYETIELALTGKIVLSMTALLLLLKLLATSITIGSGGSGGVFAPGLYMGAMLGATMGTVFNYFWPEIAITPAAYALVGMGAVFAGSAQAPITAIIMLFEMSNNYQIILPLMIACIISAVVTRGLYPANIYTVKLIRRGLDIDAARYPDAFKNITVSEAMTRKVQSIPAGITIAEAYRQVQNSPHRGFPVIDDKGQLTGIITSYELVTARQKSKELTVSAVASTDLIVTTPDEPLSTAALNLSRYNIGRLPVVEPDNPGKMVGLLSRTDIIEAYSKLLTKNNLQFQNNHKQVQNAGS